MCGSKPLYPNLARLSKSLQSEGSHAVQELVEGRILKLISPFFGQGEISTIAVEIRYYTWRFNVSSPRHSETTEV